ncbi:MAG: primase-helicase zinc-binding domain-containing protein, partial [Chloroflexota bacterium]
MVDTSSINLLSLLAGDYKRAGSTGGGEFAGPCPFCGGKDRFRVWPNDDVPRWWCRQCDAKGDAITLLQKRDGLSFGEACERLRIVLDRMP